MADRALGMIETRGLIASIEAADAMLKAAKVKLLGKEKVKAGLVTVLVVGETAAVKSAVDAGAAAAQRVGELISTHIIPRPDDQIDSIISIKSELDSVEEKSLPEKQPGRRKMQIQIEKENEEIEPAFQPGPSTTIERLKEEALGSTSRTEKPLKSKPKSELNFTMSELEVMNVHQLRRFARDLESFPIKGREISRANRGELLDYFKALLK